MSTLVLAQGHMNIEHQEESKCHRSWYVHTPMCPELLAQEPKRSQRVCIICQAYVRLANICPRSTTHTQLTGQEVAPSQSVA